LLIKQGVVPIEWKKSTIAIQKVSGTRKCEEFRPINVLPAHEKILECIVKQQFSKYLDDNNVLIDEQSGFRAVHSCESSLYLTLAAWKEQIEQKKNHWCIPRLHQRAFETIDRRLLLWKLKQYGVKGAELSWFMSYLSGQETTQKELDLVFRKVLSLVHCCSFCTLIT
jgi:hypothetical protein